MKIDVSIAEKPMQMAKLIKMYIMKKNDIVIQQIQSILSLKNVCIKHDTAPIMP